MPGPASAHLDGSNLLIKHWQNGTTLNELPSPLRPSTYAEGYTIQQLIKRLSNQPLFGWKIAATSLAGQQHINVDRPLAGHILYERVTPLGEAVSLGPNRMLVAELEFVFRVGKALPKRDKPYKVDEVMDAVDGLFLGVEVPDSRFADFVKVGAAQLIADNACADKFVLGSGVDNEVVNWRDRDLAAHVVKGYKADGSVERVGSGKEVLGDPRVAMTWIANELCEHGMMLEKGQFVTTGTCVVPIPVKAGDRVIGDFGDFGTIEVDFAE